MLYGLIGCFIIIGFLIYKLSKKVQLDNERLDKVKQDLAYYNKQVDTQKEILRQQQMDFYKLEEKSKAAKEATQYEQHKLEECKKDLAAALDVYHDMVDNKMASIDTQLEELRQKRQNELEQLHKSETERLTTEFAEYSRQLEERKTATLNAATEAQLQAREWTRIAQEDAERAQQLYQSLLEPIKQYQKTKQEKLFYTIQLPEEYQPDIEFLLTTVAAKVQHPDIISKLVWAEYVKPNLDNTYKRIEIKPEPGIYKLTSLENGMSYIGKSTDVKKRIADHFKSAVGIKSIADQAVHHAILKEGFWNWTIEVIRYCDKDELNDLEKYYIEFFKTQDFGYNKTGGG